MCAVGGVDAAFGHVGDHRRHQRVAERSRRCARPAPARARCACRAPCAGRSARCRRSERGPSSRRRRCAPRARATVSSSSSTGGPARRAARSSAGCGEREQPLHAASHPAILGERAQRARHLRDASGEHRLSSRAVMFGSRTASVASATMRSRGCMRRLRAQQDVVIRAHAVDERHRHAAARVAELGLRRSTRAARAAAAPCARRSSGRD